MKNNHLFCLYLTKLLKCCLVASFTLATLNVYASTRCRCQPNQSCWPDKQAWQQLASQLDGKLVQPSSPLAACKNSPNSQACQQAYNRIKNPFTLQSSPGATENQGWYHAWQAQPSTYAVEAQNTHDIVAAVNFARHHHLRLAIKGAGHDYLGRSSSPNSLLIWTHNMRHITYSPHFVPQGCSNSKQSVPAITVGAGTRWLEAYQVATGKHHQYVQGGGCTTVGAAGGFTQGGGFGSYSKKFGTGAASVLQAQIVTANGQVITANQCQNKDLFWAIKGGGGGTYGVVTHMTLRLHPLPKYFGVMQVAIKAKSDKVYQTLIQHFLKFYANHLNNPHWGEQVAFSPNNHLTIFMLSQGLTTQHAQQVWKPFKHWVKQSSQYQLKSHYFAIPPDKMWDYQYWHKHHPNLVTKNNSQDARPGEFWWTPNSNEVYHYWYTYQSWWLPMRFLKPDHLSKTANLFYEMSRLDTVSMHVNKGLAGASKQAINNTKHTSTNPQVDKAAALILMSAGTNKPQSSNMHSRNNPKAEATIKRINKAMSMLRQAAPNAGTYVNEADYFQKNWQQAFWGSHYDKLLKIKNRYDPHGLFYCHHCVGSEAWTNHGMCRRND